MNRLRDRRVATGMQRIGEVTARALKTLAGVDKDEPTESWVFALYVFLYLVAVALVSIWLTQPPS